MGHEQSLELTKRFDELFSGGHSNFRIAIEATEHRVFLTRAEGSHLWDVDGNEYIDYLGAMGPTILGHRHPEYTNALKDHLGVMSTAIGSGVFFTPQDVELAHLAHDLSVGTVNQDGTVAILAVIELLLSLFKSRNRLV